MTLHDAAMIFAYWKRHPPPGALLMGIAVALGMKPPDDGATAKQENKYMTAEEFARLIAVTGGKLMV
jgi:hypothetical protein